MHITEGINYKQLKIELKVRCLSISKKNIFSFSNQIVFALTFQQMVTNVLGSLTFHYYTRSN